MGGGSEAEIIWSSVRGCTFRPTGANRCADPGQSFHNSISPTMSARDHVRVQLVGGGKGSEKAGPDLMNKLS